MLHITSDVFVTSPKCVSQMVLPKVPFGNFESLNLYNDLLEDAQFPGKGVIVQ